MAERGIPANPLVTPVLRYGMDTNDLRGLAAVLRMQKEARRMIANNDMRGLALSAVVAGVIS